MSDFERNEQIDREVVKNLPKEERDRLNADPITGEPGAHPVGTGLGAVGGAATGATVGALGGPVGAVVYYFCSAFTSQSTNNGSYSTANHSTYRAA